MTSNSTYLSQDARRAQLLELGIRLFSARSFEEVSIDDIAREAGISRGLMYHYFGSKRAFYVEVVRAAAEQLTETIAIDDQLTGPENVRRGLEAYFAFVAERDQGYMALMHGAPGSDDVVHAIVEQARARIADTILSSLGADAEIAPLRLAIRAWLGQVEAAAMDWLERRDVPTPQIIEMMSASLIVQIAIASRHAPHIRRHLDVAEGMALLTRLVGGFESP